VDTGLLHIIIQYCNDPRPARAAEYDVCLRRNLANPWVKRVHNLAEPQTLVPAEFSDHPKYFYHSLGHWMKYQDAFDYANEHLPGQFVCLCNLDIFLDSQGTDWELASRMLDGPLALCLSRWEWLGDGTVQKDPDLAKRAMSTTQDAWMFQPPVNIPDCDFEIGLLGCDNAIAERIKRGGLQPINAPNMFRIFHIDTARGKTFANQKEIHLQEAVGRPMNRRPGTRGQWLVPDIAQITSLDQLAAMLKLNELQRYAAICDMLNRHYGLYGG
jgi:hypothetical protein